MQHLAIKALSLIGNSIPLNIKIAENPNAFKELMKFGIMYQTIA